MRVLAGATVWLRRIVDIVLVVLILVVLLGVALSKVVPLTGRDSIVIGGGSMEPAIHLGSAVVISPVAPTDLAVGDVVSMRIGQAQATFTHRIVAVVDRPDGRFIRTKGDANAEPDPSLVPASAVIGRVDLAIPFAGYLMALLSLPIGVIFVIGLAAMLLAIAWLLESLEPPRLVSRPAPFLTTTSASDPVRGEPIATRPAPAAFFASSTWLTPSSATPLAAAATALAPMAAVAAGRPASDPGSHPRPTVREQIARSRQTRSRRARWLSGPNRSDPAS